MAAHCSSIKWRSSTIRSFLTVATIFLLTVVFLLRPLLSCNPACEEKSHAKSTTSLVRQMFHNVSFRDERLQVTDYFIVPPQTFCNNSTFVVIVPVKVNDSIRRDDWRSTYARSSIQRKYGYSVLFAVGLAKSEEVQRKLHLESQLYGDLLQADFDDVYHNLTQKMLSALRFVFSSCPQTKAFIKVDDDAGWNIRRTRNLVLHYLDYNKVYGQLDAHRRPDNNNTKWGLTREEWSRPELPPFCRGMAYVIPRRAAEKLLAVVPFQRFLKLEDVFITGVLSEAANVTVSHIGSDRITLKERMPGIHNRVNFAFFKIDRAYHLHWFLKVNGGRIE